MEDPCLCLSGCAVCQPAVPRPELSGGGYDGGGAGCGAGAERPDSAGGPLHPWWTAAGTDRTTPGTRQRTAFRGWGGTGWICWCSPTSTTTTPTACPSCWSGCRCPPSPCRTWREDSPLRREILTLAEEKGIPLWWVRRDTTVELEKGQLTLYPPLGAGEANELGLSVLAGAGGLDLLVTGDMSGDVEGMLVEHAGLRDVELLVAGHHGSASLHLSGPAERPSAGDCHPSQWGGTTPTGTRPRRRWNGWSARVRRSIAPTGTAP